MNDTPIHHDYSKRHWGHDYVFEPQPGGQKAHMIGWGCGIEPGHFLIIQNGKDTTRYKVDDITYYNDPPDMWSANVSFAPRPRPEEA